MKIKFVFLSVLVFLLCVLIINSQTKTSKSITRFKNSKYNGVISDIRVRKDNRGHADIKISSEWIALGLYGTLVHGYIRIGDSIVKESNSTEIKVYKKTTNNEWEMRKFECVK